MSPASIEMAIDYIILWCFARSCTTSSTGLNDRPEVIVRSHFQFQKNSDIVRSLWYWYLRENLSTLRRKKAKHFPVKCNLIGFSWFLLVNGVEKFCTIQNLHNFYNCTFTYTFTHTFACQISDFRFLFDNGPLSDLAWPVCNEKKLWRHKNQWKSLK